MSDWKGWIDPKELKRAGKAMSAAKVRADESVTVTPVGETLLIASRVFSTTIPLLEVAATSATLGVSTNFGYLLRLFGLDHGKEHCQIIVSDDALSVGTTSISGRRLRPTSHVPGSQEDIEVLRTELRNRVASGETDPGVFRAFAILGRPADFIELGVLQQASSARSDYESAMKRAESALKKYGVTRNDFEPTVRLKYAADVSRRLGRV